MLLKFLLVAAGGAIGAVCRYSISLLTVRMFGTSYPWGTLIANAAGSFCMGLLIGIMLGVGLQRNLDSLYLFLGVGILGSCTTFSAFSGETLTLWLDGRQWAALGNVVGNVVVSLTACVIGFAIVQLTGGSEVANS
ncbi:MAG: fluoride efflux transporter FluC [Pirellulaceae bacterium]